MRTVCHHKTGDTHHNTVYVQVLSEGYESVGRSLNKQSRGATWLGALNHVSDYATSSHALKSTLHSKTLLCGLSLSMSLPYRWRYRPRSTQFQSTSSACTDNAICLSSSPWHVDPRGTCSLPNVGPRQGLSWSVAAGWDLKMVEKWLRMIAMFAPISC